MDLERLSKFLSRRGIASRRKCDEIIASGRVSVNGNVVRDPFYRVDPSQDAITLDGNRLDLSPHSPPVYIALNKPAGYLSDLSDPQGRRMARQLIHVETRLYPVGRLDYNSEGLMIFTNDGEFANSVMHPRYTVEKEYLVKLSGQLSPGEQQRMLHGLSISGQVYRVSSVAEIKRNPGSAWYRIVVAEGKNRMIRRLAEALNHPVIRLRRVRIDGIRLGRLKPGEYRHISTQELAGIALVSKRSARQS